MNLDSQVNANGLGMKVSELKRLLASMPMNATVYFDTDAWMSGAAAPVSRVEHMPAISYEAGFVVLSS